MKSPMLEAVESARIGITIKDGGPFGAAVVKGDTIISVEHNTVLRDNDPTAHAEVNAIRAATRYLQTHDLSGCTLYTTCEPCPMCMGAILWARIDRVVVGSNREAAKKVGFDDVAFLEEVRKEPQDRQIPMVWEESDAASALFAEWQTLNGTLY